MTSPTAPHEEHGDKMSTLTPVALAHAIGVSESSIKRWCDVGKIPAFRTVGGHRRIARNDAIAFIRQSGVKVVDPESLGVADEVIEVKAGSAAERDALRRDLLIALLENDPQRVQRLMLGAFMSIPSLGRLVDDVIAPTFRRVGDCWESGDVAIYQERRACEIVTGVIAELSRLIPVREAGSRAIGATFAGDHYTLPGRLAELVLRDGGWNAMMLGNGLPASVMAAALDEYRPDLFWVSVSHFEDLETFRTEFGLLANACARHRIPLVAGGRVLTSSVRRQLEFACFCDTMQHLERFAESIATR